MSSRLSLTVRGVGGGVSDTSRYGLPLRVYGWVIAAVSLVMVIVAGAVTVIMVAMTTPPDAKLTDFTGILGLYVAVTGMVALLGAVGTWLGLGRRCDHEGATFMWLQWWASVQGVAAVWWVAASFSDPKITGVRAMALPVLAVVCALFAVASRRRVERS